MAVHCTMMANYRARRIGRSRRRRQAWRTTTRHSANARYYGCQACNSPRSQITCADRQPRRASFSAISDAIISLYTVDALFFRHRNCTRGQHDRRQLNIGRLRIATGDLFADFIILEMRTAGYQCRERTRARYLRAFRIP